MELQDFCLSGAVKIRDVSNDPFCKIFYTRGKLLGYADYDNYMVARTVFNEPRNVPVLTSAIYYSILEIEAVGLVSIFPYEVQIFIRSSFSWEEDIFPQIKRIFASYLQWETEIGSGLSKWK